MLNRLTVIQSIVKQNCVLQRAGSTRRVTITARLALQWQTIHSNTALYTHALAILKKEERERKNCLGILLFLFLLRLTWISLQSF